MRQEAADSSPTYKYCTLRYVVDWARDVEVPVGVAIWSEDSGHFFVRLPKTGERIQDVAVAKAMPYVQAVESQIHEWLQGGSLPYSGNGPSVLSDKWWEHIRGLLRFKIRLGEPQPIDCVQPDTELEALFEAAVQPRQPVSQRMARVETQVNRALGKELADQFAARSSVAGFRDRAVPVQKAVERDSRWLVVEAVNLATPDAEHDADALASRVLRIKEGPLGSQVRFAIGYIASPNGLNGEAVMKEWIEKKSDTPIYDLTREAIAFNQLVVGRLNEIDPQTTLSLPETGCPS